MRNRLRLGTSIIGWVLTAVGIAGVPDDLRTWSVWLKPLAGDAGRWALTVAGVTIATSTYLPVWWRRLREVRHETRSPTVDSALGCTITSAEFEGDSMRVQAGKFSGGSDNPKWQLLTGLGERPFSKRIDFSYSFNEPPIVVVALSGLDVDDSANLRVTVDAQDVDRNGFSLVLKTWSNTKIYRLWVQWTAYGN